MSSRAALGLVLRFAVMCVVVVGSVGCRDSEGRAFAAPAQQRRPPPPRRDAPAPVGTTADRTFSLEFDASEDFLKRGADGAFLVRSFQVGFFAGGTLVYAYEVLRTTAQLAGARIKLAVAVPTVAATREGGTLDVKVRGLTPGTLGPWSESAGSVRVQVEAAPARARRDRDAPRPESPRAADRGRLTVEGLSRFPALKEALSQVLRGTPEADAVAACGTAQNLATAVVLSRKHELPVVRLCSALSDRSTDPLRDLLSTKGGSQDVARELKAARSEARTLVRNRERQAPARPAPAATRP